MITFVIFNLFSFRIFNVQRNQLLRLPVNGQNYKVDISFVTAGATTEDVIQVKKIYSDGSEEIIKNFSRYNELLEHKQITDSTIQIVLLNSRYSENEPDTFLIKIM